jgi:hypothetical protein
MLVVRDELGHLGTIIAAFPDDGQDAAVAPDRQVAGVGSTRVVEVPD